LRNPFACPIEVGFAGIIWLNGHLNISWKTLCFGGDCFAADAKQGKAGLCG
jgi:hypothetical protein